MAMWIPFMTSMLLGRTFDANNLNSGLDIFPTSTVNANTIVTPSYSVTTNCRLIESDISKRKLLNIGADISVAFNVKAVGVSLNPSFEYLKDTRDHTQAVEYTCHVKYNTVTYMLATEARPVTGWTSRWNKKDLGTHYVRSITYGGEMIASFLFKAKTDHDIQRIAGALKAGVTIYGIGVNVGVKFDRITNDLKRKATINVKYYSTTSIDSVPTEFQSFKGVIDDFSAQVAKVNGGKGVPVSVELWELYHLDSTIPAFLTNVATRVVLEGFEGMLEDVKQADAELQKWALTLPPLTADKERQLGQLSSELASMMQKFMEIGEQLDFTQGPAQFETPMNIYRTTGGFNLPHKFSWKVRMLKRSFGGA